MIPDLSSQTLTLSGGRTLGFAERGDPAGKPVTDVLLLAMSESNRNGTDGAAWEGAMLVRPWGFELGDIAIPVVIWNEADNAHATIFPGEGHFLVLKR